METLYNELKNILEVFLKGKHSEIASFSPNTSPLFLLLTVKPDLVGFATLDGQPQENFSKAFQKFKDLYSIHSSEWADFDLTLVLCKTDTKKIPDEFCNETEINPYFCRKFIIDLNRDLKVELRRLPFIPLRPETIVGLKRPISAQTFLMKHGLNSNLARYLVVPHARGIERIIEECLAGDLGKPTWFRTEIKEFPVPSQEEGKPNVRLKELEIRNFRAYRESYEFDLDADLVVLYGPNGFGKTSFFDALDFVYTGGVARFDERFGRKTHRLLNALKHLDSSLDDSFVKVKSATGSSEIIIERYIKNRTKALVDGGIKDRTNTLLLLTGLAGEPPDLRIENLIRLFRASHLFGQEYQVLTPELRKESKLPQDTVSRMLAFQDYVEATNKTKKVTEELRRKIKEKELEITFPSNYLRSKEIDMEQLSKLAKTIKKPEKISEVSKEIAGKIILQANIPIEIPKELNKEIVREWRTKIGVEKNNINKKLEVIEKLEAKFPELAIHRKKSNAQSLELAKKKELLVKLNKDYSKRKEKLEESNKNLNKMFPEEKNLTLKRENINWLLQVKDEYQQYKEQIVKENKNYRDIQEKLLEFAPNIGRLKSENKASDETVDKITSETRILENSLKDLGDFEKSVGDWLKATNRHKELRVYLEMIEQEVDNVKNELRIKKDELNTAIITQDGLKKYLDNLQQSQSELETLLDTIERHISDNICPVCGTLHKSREDLIEKLKIQRGIQPKNIREALKLFEVAKGKTDELKKYVGNLELKLKQSEQKVAETRKELFNVAEKIKTYEEKAITLDIQKTSDDLVAVFDFKKKNVLEQMNIKQKQLFEQKTKTQKKHEELTILIMQQENLGQDLRAIESKLSQLQSMIDKITSDALTRQISLELEKENIQRELINTNSIIEYLCKQIEIVQTENHNLKKEVDSLLEKKNLLEREIQELDMEILDSKKYMEEVQSLIKRLNLNLDIDLNQVVDLKKDIMLKLSSLDSLQNEIINFEIALDAVETSAALAKIRQEIKNVKKQLQDLRKEPDRLNNWLSYFDVTRKELELLQNQALNEYTEKYGPLTSTIQKRLRSVYGFGEIGIHPEKGGIAVRVERKGNRDISPSDYFSESQIQIVMLSLFLSATLTQTWSSFAPILLDDPVEHFDDLNAYSLLDLIRGLITEPGKQRQFIISTCEDRLFRLMRQKFSKMNGRVIFYVFESIGENGPKIKRL